MRLTTTTAGVLCGAALWISGCGGGGGETPIQPGPRVLTIAGTYQIAQALIQTTCGDAGATIPSVTATVTHTAGGADFTMRDTGGTTFTGTVQPTGDFSAAAVFGPDSSGNTFTQSLQGRFTATGFTGPLTVDVQPRNCRFSRNWTANKQGSPNVIP